MDGVAKLPKLNISTAKESAATVLKTHDIVSN